MLFASGNAHLFSSEHRRMLGTSLENKVFTVHGGEDVKNEFQASSAVQFDDGLKLSSDDVKSADAATKILWPSVPMAKWCRLRLHTKATPNFCTPLAGGNFPSAL